MSTHVGYVCQISLGCSAASFISFDASGLDYLAITLNNCMLSPGVTEELMYPWHFHFRVPAEADSVWFECPAARCFSTSFLSKFVAMMLCDVSI